MTSAPLRTELRVEAALPVASAELRAVPSGSASPMAGMQGMQMRMLQRQPSL